MLFPLRMPTAWMPAAGGKANEILAYCRDKRKLNLLNLLVFRGFAVSQLNQCSGGCLDSIRIREHGADRGYGVCPGVEHLKSIPMIDAADCYQRHLSNYRANSAQSVDSQNRIGIVFGLGRKDRAGSQIIYGGKRSASGLLFTVEGKSNDGVGPQQPARTFRWKIGLAQVNAVSVKRQGNIDAIVNKKLDAQLACDSQCITGFIVESAGGQMLFSDLN